MICRRITLRDFRNIKEAEVCFRDGVNVLLGDNAQGKTNLLEAIYFAAIGKSFRGQHAAEVIRFGCETASLSLDFFSGEREQNITVQLSRDRARSVTKNKVKITRMSELLGSFRAVLFCPEYLSLIKDGPAERRHFLDVAICAAEPLYLAELQRYERVLKQRNALIRSAEEGRREKGFLEQMEIWSEQLAESAAFIARSRKRYIDRAAVFVAACFGEMSGMRETPALQYHCHTDRDGVDYEDLAAVKGSFFRLLTSAGEREIAAGATLYGIHKDDMEVTLNGVAARLYCSQGQQRSLALALKLAEGEIAREDCGEYPVFLFDDVLSELDRARQSYLLEHIKGKQVIMTACERGERQFPHEISVKEGSYRQERDAVL